MIHYKKVVSGVACVLTLLLLYLALFYVNLPTLNGRVFYSERPRVFSLYPSPSPAAPTSPTNFTGLKKILYWNDFFGKKDYYFGVGRQPFVDMGCPVDTCYATYNRDVFPIMEVDALIWHIRSYDRSLPSQRSLHTRYVFFLEESPRNQHTDLTLYKDVFNYTMTYRRDSDIFAPYGLFKQRQTPLADDNFNYAAGKTKMAAWFVSNCKTDSGRENLVEKLQAFVQVDVYGACGPFDCAKDDHGHCLKMLDTDYKFYLAFENSLCTDYVTEKFFGVTSHSVIPVVYGVAPYAAIAPPHSFINVFDYKSVEQLANHLTFLSHNDTAYNEYFRWRKTFEQVPSKSWCDLCAKLHSDKRVKTYDIYNWYEENKCVNSANVSLIY